MKTTGKFEISGQSIEEEYISNMQQQVYLLEQENGLLQGKEKEREALMGLELSDGQPLNEHMVQLKLKYEKKKRELQAELGKKEKAKQEAITAINGLKTDNQKLTENCDHLRAKIERTRKKMQEDDTQFRERKDEIDNEIERCRKTNKQAFGDLMEAKTEINENLNKKREVERKIEDENKKFREIEGELLKKISEYNRNIAEAKHEKNTLSIDKKEDLSLKKIKNYNRELSNKVGDLKGDSEAHSLNVKKFEKQIEIGLQSMQDNYKDISHKKTLIEAVEDQIKGLDKEKLKEKLDENLKSHSQKLIFRLEIETDQEKERSDNFFENIKQIEQDTNKYRNQ